MLATDVGGEKRARNVARQLGVPLAIVLKERIGNEERVEAQNLIGDVDGRDILIVDDEIVTGGTIMEAADIALSRGARKRHGRLHPRYPVRQGGRAHLRPQRDRRARSYRHAAAEPKRRSTPR